MHSDGYGPFDNAEGVAYAQTLMEVAAGVTPKGERSSYVDVNPVQVEVVLGQTLLSLSASPAEVYAAIGLVAMGLHGDHPHPPLVPPSPAVTSLITETTASLLAPTARAALSQLFVKEEWLADWPHPDELLRTMQAVEQALNGDSQYGEDLP
jgi:hypothetical protein